MTDHFKATWTELKEGLGPFFKIAKIVFIGIPTGIVLAYILRYFLYD